MPIGSRTEHYMDEKGVWYLRGRKQYYLSNQVMALAVADGKKEKPPGGEQAWEDFLCHCDPKIKKCVLQCV